MLGLVAIAAGAEKSQDVELLRPTFEPDAVLGVESAAPDAPGTFRVGLTTQLEGDPVVAVTSAGEHVSAVHFRLVGVQTATGTVSRRTSVGLALAQYVQEGDGELAADGFFLADPTIGVRFAALQERTFELAGRAELRVPLGAKDAWAGELGPRVQVGWLADWHFGPLTLLGDAGATLRVLAPEVRDHTLADTVDVAVGARYWPTDLVSFTGSAVGRLSLAVAQDLVAESPGEALVGVELHSGAATISLGLGGGVTPGVGAAAWRVAIGLSWFTLPPMRAPVPEVLPVEPCAPVRYRAPEHDWEAGELVMASGDAVLLRDPIRFFPGTAEVRPSSRGMVDELAAFLRNEPRVRLLVVEGHADEDGGYADTWSLSEARAHTIVAALIEAGVAPTRLAARGVGKVAPAPGIQPFFQPHLALRIAEWGVGDPPTPTVVPWTGAPQPADEPPAESP